MSMQSSSKPVDPIPPERRAIFDEFVYNHLPRHLLHLKTGPSGSTDDLEISVISASQLQSVFEFELGDILRRDKKPIISEDEIKKRLGDLFQFAIFSHRWFPEGEPSFQAVDAQRPFTRGYHKLLNFCMRAVQFRCRLAWSDTCCIDKTSSAELDEAIRSMFRWYRLAHVCIVHLSGSTSLAVTDELEHDVWFTRGWTLQELLAPERLKFYGKDWQALTGFDNDKDDDTLMARVSRITHVPVLDLRKFEPGTKKIRERMSWASQRTTTRTEDVAYSLIGIFDVNLPIAYGEGTWAFYRLMEVIVLRCDEWGIFAWAGPPSTYHSRTTAIPSSPACYHVIDVGRFPDENGRVHGDTAFTLSRQGLQLRVMVAIGDLERCAVDVQGDHAEREEEEERERSRHYTFEVKPSYAGPTFTTVHVRSTTGIEVNEYTWAIGILNYRVVEPEEGYGKLEGERSYVCFLLRRHEDEEDWTREPTDNILIVDTLFASDSRERLRRQWL